MRRILFALPVVLMLSAQAPAPKAPTPVSKGPSADKLAQQCRAACDKRYYFCLAEGEPEFCAPNWGQCRARCGSALPR